MKILRFIAGSTLLLSLAACGGGSGGSTSSTPAAPATPPAGGSSTVLSGIASKGPFLHDSIVKVYAVTNGAKGSLITQTTTTDDNGSYSADLGSYTGPVMVEVSGTFHDEATGHDVPVAVGAPIRAAIPLAQGNVTLPVTPLTELAVQKAVSLAPSAISAANTLVSDLFKVNIVATMPVAPTSAAMAAASQAQKDYTLALAAVSQLASQHAGSDDTAKLAGALTALSQGISSNGMDGSTSAAFVAALNTFVTSNPNNKTGVADTSDCSLASVGTLSKSYTLMLQGISGTVDGVQFDLALPSGVTVNVNSLTSSVLGSSLALAGSLSDAMMASKFSGGKVTVGIVTTKGIGSGVFATVTCNVAAGQMLPPASAFVISNLKVVDLAGGLLSGASVTVN